MANREWYKEWFNSPYYDLLYLKRDHTEAERFVKSLITYLQPTPGSYMLDAGCGKGRHGKALAEMGFDVTGLDPSETMIMEAKHHETDNLHFYQHDMRLPFHMNYFDYAFNLFTSFGYFQTQREHDNVIRSISQSLKNGGIFIIDYLNTHYTEDHLVRSEEKTIESVQFHITRWHNEKYFFKQIQTGHTNKTYKHLFTEKVAKFSPGDFTDMLAYQDMQVQDIFGDYQLGDYNVRKSPRMIIVAKKKVH